MKSKSFDLQQQQKTKQTQKNTLLTPATNSTVMGWDGVTSFWYEKLK